MKKIGMLLSQKTYAIKRRYPVFCEFQKRMDSVKKELDKIGKNCK